MKLTRISLYFLLIITTGIVLINPVSAVSIREILGLESKDKQQAEPPQQEVNEIKTAETAKDTKNDSQKDTGENSKTNLEFDEVQKIISILSDEQRKTLLADNEAFLKFVKQEAGNKSVLAAAKANKVDKNEKTIFLTQRGIENILREYYLNQLIVTKIPADFPTDKQVQDYYQNNKEKFFLGERVHVWQIFLPIDDNMKKKEIELLKKEAESISSDLQKGKIDFTAAAQKYSGHEASKFNGGYLGLVKVSDLKPEIQKPLMALAEGKLSKPVTSDVGIHIMKRGAIVPKQPLEMEQVHDQIKKLLITQIRNKLRQEVYKQAGITYPVDINDEKIEEWRLKLRTNTPANAVTTVN